MKNSAGTSEFSPLANGTPEAIVRDIDGNIYQAVAIGGQVWMAENLKVTHYRNGDPVPVTIYTGKNLISIRQKKRTSSSEALWNSITESRNH